LSFEPIPSLDRVMNTPEPFSVRQFVGVLRRRRLVLAQTVAIVGVAAVVLSLQAPSRFESTAVLLSGSAKSLPLPGLENPQQLSPGTAARLVRTRAVAERVRKAIATDLSVDQLLGKISTSANADGFTMVTAHGDSGSEAALLANAFATQFVALRAETPYVGLRKAVRAIQRQLNGSTGSERSALLAQLTQLETVSALPTADVEVVDPAVVPGASSGPNLLFSIAAGLGLGLLLGLAVILALEALDPRIKSFSELQRLVRAPQLAGIPADVFHRPLRGRKEPRVLRTARDFPGAFEHLRTSLLVFNAERQLKTILVTSPRDEREGKTTVAGNLAVSLAKVGLRVCAVDADLRGPRLARHFGLDSELGLAEVIEGKKLDFALQQFPIPGLPAFLSGNGNGSKPHLHELSVLAAGTRSPNPSELLASEGMQNVLDNLEERFDVVVVDCPPVLAEADSLSLLTRASGTLLVVRLFHTTRNSASRAAQVIENAHGGLLGVVGTGVPARELREEGYGPWPVAQREATRVG
jgi:Mrp family chromosome partitioning ATPase